MILFSESMNFSRELVVLLKVEEVFSQACQTMNGYWNFPYVNTLLPAGEQEKDYYIFKGERGGGTFWCRISSRVRRFGTILWIKSSAYSNLKTYSFARRLLEQSVI